MSALQILGWVASPVASCVIGYLFSRLQQLKKSAKEKEEQYIQERKALKETCKYMLRKFLKDDYEYYVDGQGWCSSSDKAEVQQAYDLYHDSWNGNGQGTRYYNAIMALPEHPEHND